MHTKSSFPFLKFNAGVKTELMNINTGVCHALCSYMQIMSSYKRKDIYSAMIMF